MTTIDESKLAGLTLAKGAHKSPEEGVCILEAISWLRGVKFSDHPACVSPALGDFLRPFNDGLDDENRQRLIPYIPRIVGTAGDASADKRRRQMVWDWVLDTWLPTWLRLAKLDEAAERVTKERTTEAIMAARDKANAAWAAAWDAARAAARDAARAAAWDAARAAAGDAAWDAARDAARAAARAAARDAAWDAAGDYQTRYAAARQAADVVLRDAVDALRESAFQLLDRLVAA